MADLKLLDRAFYLIIQRFIATGQAPHYTELAKDLGLSVEDGRKLVHELMEAPFLHMLAGSIRPGCTRAPIISLPLRPLIICPLSIASP